MKQTDSARHPAPAARAGRGGHRHADRPTRRRAWAATTSPFSRCRASTSSTSRSARAPRAARQLTRRCARRSAEALDYDTSSTSPSAARASSQPSPIPNGFAGTDGLAAPAQNLDKAKKLLAGKTIYAFDATFPSVNVYGVDFSTAMQEVQSELKKVGITLNLNPVEISVWADRSARTASRDDAVLRP